MVLHCCSAGECGHGAKLPRRKPNRVDLNFGRQFVDRRDHPEKGKNKNPHVDRLRLRGQHLVQRANILLPGLTIDNKEPKKFSFFLQSPWRILGAPIPCLANSFFFFLFTAWNRWPSPWTLARFPKSQPTCSCSWTSRYMSVGEPDYWTQTQFHTQTQTSTQTQTHRNTRKLFTDSKKQAYSCGHCGLPLHHGLPCSFRSEPWRREEGKFFPTHALQQLQGHSKGSISW